MLEAFIIIVIHFVGDFIVQTDKQAKGKSKNWEDLVRHTLSYSLLWMIVGSLLNVTDLLVLPSGYLTGFVGITFICHTITDYFTSRLNSKLWQKGEVHNFFVGIGGDQVLHYAQLFLTYYFVTK